MLKLFLPKIDIWDDRTEEFKELGGIEVEFEHSLYTVAAWEAKWKIPFAKKKGLTREQLFDYITNFMCQTANVPTDAWLCLNGELVKRVSEYLEDSNTATTIKHIAGGSKSKGSGVVTAEVIYFYMAQFGIPFECEHWHLNRLMKLIEVCAEKNSPPKKMSAKEAAMMREKQNQAMRQKLGSRG